MNGQAKNLNAKGEFNYDYRNDILFFKVKNREYEKSIELENMVIDIDSEDFLVGLQIFDASKYFGIPKVHLRVAFQWKMQASISKVSEEESKMEVRLMFQIKIRNKIRQPEPIITQNIRDSLEDSKMVCVAGTNSQAACLLRRE
jgi:uncharacterized protein YuzE